MTALCLTKNRPKFLKRAIESFLLQSYPLRELLILADGDRVDHLLEKLEPELLRELEQSGKRNDIRYIHLSGVPTIGEKRNIGSELAAGDLVVSWDDDDWSAPFRITDQVSRLIAADVAVTGYHSMLFTDGRSWWKYQGTKTTNLGSSLCYRRSWWEDHPFKPKHVNEDGEFIEEAIRHKQYIAVDAGDLMVASIHAGNSSPRTLIGRAWKKFPGKISPEGYRNI